MSPFYFSGKEVAGKFFEVRCGMNAPNEKNRKPSGKITCEASTTWVKTRGETTERSFDEWIQMFSVIDGVKIYSVEDYAVFALGLAFIIIGAAILNRGSPEVSDER